MNIAADFIATNAASLAEYNTLREEVLQCITAQRELMLAIVLAMSAAIGAVATSDKISKHTHGIHALCQFVLLCFSAAFIVIEVSIMRVTSYIRVFIETDSNILGWERRLAQINNANSYTSFFGDMNPASIILALSLPILSIIVLATLLHIQREVDKRHKKNKNANLSVKKFTRIFAFICFGINMTLWLWFAYSSIIKPQGFKSYYIQEWGDIKANEPIAIP